MSWFHTRFTRCTWLRAAVMALCFMGWTFGSASAAPAGGEVEGIVRDALQRPLAGVALRIETPDGRVIMRTTSGLDGRYRFENVPPGVYSVIGEHEGFATSTAIVSVSVEAGAASDLTLAAKQALDLKVIAQRLEEARIGIQPRVGASTYTLSQQTVEEQPRGANNPLNQVLLQAPGITQDSFGQVHVRNEHANLQYRINGVALPEGVNLFGQALSPRIAGSMDLITGAMPAQYGLRTAGVIDMQTKSGVFNQGGSIDFYGGTQRWRQPSFEYGGSAGTFNYYVTGDYLENNLGIENPTRSLYAIHDKTQQEHFFGYFENIIDPTSKISAIFGTFHGDFEIPNRPNFPPTSGFNVNGITDFDSATLRENQSENTTYGILAYLKSEKDFDLQIAPYTRYSDVHFKPDVLGDLVFNGIAQDATRRSFANGLQTEGTYRLTDDHTLRSGIIISENRTTSLTNSLVLPGDGTSGDPATSVVDNIARTGWYYSYYLQDEWRVTPKLTVNYGGRFDVVDAFTHEHEFSPRLNGVYQLTSSTTVHAGYAHYFTPPPQENLPATSIQKFVGTAAEAPNQLNDLVRSERADYYDVGVTQVVTTGLKLGVDLYYKRSRNLLDEGQFGAPVILTAFNYRDAWNRGIEFTGTYDTPHFSTYGNLAIADQKAKDITSAQFNFDPGDLDFISSQSIPTDHRQTITASSGIAYRWDSGARVTGTMIAGSGLRRSVTGPNQEHEPFYQQFNIGAAQRFEPPTTGPWEIRFDIINVLDKPYALRDGTGVGVGAPQFGPRRAFYAGLRKFF